MATPVLTPLERTAVLEESFDNLNDKMTKVVGMVEDLHTDYLSRKANWGLLKSAGRYLVWAAAGISAWAGWDHASAWFSKGIH